MFLFALSTPLFAEQASDVASESKQVPPCQKPEAKQFDFWVGDWDLTWERSADEGKTWSVECVEWKIAYSRKK